MTSKERMLTAMMNGQPDSVPVAPDISNMVPCKLTGKPFWDIYLYDDPPWWQAYINAAKHFGLDGWLYSVPLELEYEREAREGHPVWQEAIVARTDERIYTRRHAEIDGRRKWSDNCTVYYIADSPTYGVPPAKVGLPVGPPAEWEDVQRRTHFSGLEAYHEANRMMGDDGVVALSVGLPGLAVWIPETIYEYYDNHSEVIERCERQREQTITRLKGCLGLRPDLILVGISGHMIGNPEPIFRELCLPTLKEITALCKAAGTPSQIHCCGPEYDLVKIAAEETDLDSINPLEHPPMGDCDLARVKSDFGDRISLMGNLHTTTVMLRGTPDDVRDASKKAIDDAAEGGGFILSTGDQCGRETPFENLFTMVETAREYGEY
jgi:uroporphyrinogen decarboxylase